MRYSQEALDEMASKVDLFEYMSKTLDFTMHSGSTYYAICPFHHEVTPSFAIDINENKRYHCFGCGKSGGIYNWLMEIEGLSFPQAIEKVVDLTGSNPYNYIESDTMTVFKTLEKGCIKPEVTDPERQILDINKDYYQKYSDELPQEWIDEGISGEEIRKYQIRIDKISNRIVYPVFSNDNDLINVKGRTRYKNYKELKISKYISYFKIGGLDFFQGMQQAREYIKQSGEVIILEGLKSVMKVDQWGYHNAVSAETSTLTDAQITLLVGMHIKNVVIAFDKDVTMKKILPHIKMLKRFTNVYVVLDKWKLLEEKDSPCDKGRNVWNTLYERKVRI